MLLRGAQGKSKVTMKRIATVSISLGFFAICWLFELVAELLGRKTPGRCVVLYYHAIPEQHKSRFERQMDDLIHLAEPTRADRQEPLTVGRRYAVVTFDDAYQNVIAYALPVLKARNIASTIFVAPGILGRIPEVADASTGSVRESKIMSVEELRELQSDLASIGSHSLSHPDLTKLNAKEAMHELSESRRTLEEMLQRSVTLFCFPYGACNQELFHLCRDAGYKRAFTTLPEWALVASTEFVTGRVRVDASDWRIEFRLKLLGAYRWLPAVFAMKKRILRGSETTPVRRMIASN